MSFQTCFTKIERGIWSHNATGMVVHEVFSFEQLLAANGVLIHWDDDDTYAFAAGRTLATLMRAGSAVALTDVAQAMNFATWIYDGHVHIHAWNGGSLVGTKRPILTSKQLGAPTKIARVFAVVTNAYDGFKPRYVTPSFGAHGGAPTVPTKTPCYSSSVDGAFSAPNPTYGSGNGRDVLGGKTVAPHVIVRLRSALDVDEFWAHVVNETEHNDQPQVQDYLTQCRERFDRFRAALPVSSDMACSFMPSPSGVQFLSAQRNAALNSQTQPTSPWYGMLYRAGGWTQVPMPITSDGNAIWSVDVLPAWTYARSVTRAIGAVPIRQLLGGVAGQHTGIGTTLAVSTLVNVTTQGMTNILGDPGRPIQNPGEPAAAFQGRLQASKPTFTSLNGFGYLKAPGGDYPGCVGWLIPMAGMSMSEDTMVGEALNLFAEYASPAATLLSTQSASGVSDIVRLNQLLGVKWFDGKTLETICSSVSTSGR